MHRSTQVLIAILALATTVSVVLLIKYAGLPFVFVFIPTALNMALVLLTKTSTGRLIHLGQSAAATVATLPPASELLPYVTFTYRGFELVAITEVLSMLQGMLWIILAVLQATYIYKMIVST